ncbi:MULTISPECIES: hypothetical protein [unclassified Rhodanobacter]|uniref:hypothetical protein n=1 Tax=unclassified Rhodanobacter TaxID=2621553 RepID=UPI0007AA1EB6|nr:hypothetical protein [Rhodanobacter sp. FW510-R10]KZC32576.1 hypothetical protein RhoFW510R10_11720 [Rhodanobacter sp. FW510-R10]
MLSKEQIAPTAITPPDDARAMLDTLMDALRMTDVANDLFERMPTIHEAALRLVWLVPPGVVYPYTRTSVAEYCLRDAVQAASAMKGDVAVAVFVSHLVANVSRLLELEIGTDEQRWNPTTDLPLLEWMDRHGQASVRVLQGDAYELYSPRRFAATIAYRVLNPRDMRYVSGDARHRVVEHRLGEAA